MNLNDVKDMMENMGWHTLGLESQELNATFKSIEDGIEEITKKIDDIDKSCSKFMSAHDISYPRQYPKPKGNFPQHYPKAKSTPPKKKVDPMFQEREKSDAGKLADKFTELLKKK